MEVNIIMGLIEIYGVKHELARTCGSEYIYQDDEAQEDAIKLVSDIFDVISASVEEGEE